MAIALQDRVIDEAFCPIVFCALCRVERNGATGAVLGRSVRGCGEAKEDRWVLFVRAGAFSLGGSVVNS